MCQPRPHTPTQDLPMMGKAPHTIAISALLTAPHWPYIHHKAVLSPPTVWRLQQLHIFTSTIIPLPPTHMLNLSTFWTDFFFFPSGLWKNLQIWTKTTNMHSSKLSIKYVHYVFKYMIVFASIKKKNKVMKYIRHSFKNICESRN